MKRIHTDKAVFYTIIIKIIGTSLGQTYTEMDSLLGHLFNASRYNKFVRPLHNQTHVIKVCLRFTLYLMMRIPNLTGISIILDKHNIVLY
jgi:hypothetical protein